MSDPLTLALALLVGAVLGAFFFCGLWWTVKKGLASETPALWFLGSLMLRCGLTVAGFYFVAHGEWSRFLACLVGFLTARVIVVKWLARTRVGPAFQPDNGKEVRLESLTYEKETKRAP
jgi:F1F0 ATPase subunit 2